jgi:hypothetical protein
VPKLSETKPSPRILICGEPASGKTGALAQLANAGYRLMIHDFDQNSRVINSYLTDKAAEVYINTYASAKLADVKFFPDSNGAVRQAATELQRFGQMLMHWQVPGGEDLGPCGSWTNKDVVVIDSGTFLGDMLLLAAQGDPKYSEKMLMTKYGIAGDWYGAILDRLTGNRMGATVIVLTHIMQTGDKDDQGRITGKARDIPVGVGDKFSKKMQTYFSDIWHLEVDRMGKRTFKTMATDKAALRTSAPLLIKPVEEYDLASMLDRLTGAK